MCLAPCFAGCSKEEYAAEVQRLVQFLDTGGNSLRSAIEQERERASEDLDFERAAAIHKRIEKLDAALRGQSELARSINDIDAVILQRAAGDQTIVAFAIRRGRLIEPCFIRFAEIAGQPRSAEQIFRDYLEPHEPEPRRAVGNPAASSGCARKQPSTWTSRRSAGQSPGSRSSASSGSAESAAGTAQQCDAAG